MDETTVVDVVDVVEASAQPIAVDIEEQGSMVDLPVDVPIEIIAAAAVVESEPEREAAEPPPSRRRGGRSSSPARAAADKADRPRGSGRTRKKRT